MRQSHGKSESETGVVVAVFRGTSALPCLQVIYGGSRMVEIWNEMTGNCIT